MGSCGISDVRGAAIRPVLRRMGSIQRNPALSGEIQRKRSSFGGNGISHLMIPRPTVQKYLHGVMKNSAVRGPDIRPGLRRRGEIQGNSALSGEIQRTRQLHEEKGDFEPRNSAVGRVEILPGSPKISVVRGPADGPDLRRMGDIHREFCPIGRNSAKSLLIWVSRVEFRTSRICGRLCRNICRES